jgi:hypothetical protein
LPSSIPDQPVVEPQATNGKLRNVLEEASIEDKEVHGLSASGPAFRTGSLSERGSPVGISKSDGLWNLDIQTLADGKKVIIPAQEALECPPKIRSQHDVAVDVAESVKTRGALSLLKKIGDQGHAFRRSLHIREVNSADLPRELSSPFVISQQDDLRLGDAPNPAQNCVTLQ